MTKRIVICSDGTWDTADKRYHTNVVKMRDAIARDAQPDGTIQMVKYDPGVGTGNLLDRIRGGVLGRGLNKNIKDCYRSLIDNYEDGDEIFLFGFSRGAYTVRSLAGLVRKCWLPHKNHADKVDEAFGIYRKADKTPDTPEAIEFRARFSRKIEIKFIGVWDTVGSLGIPAGMGSLFDMLRKLTRWRYKFHDTGLSRYVKNAYHAIAIDERRAPFAPTLWEAQRPKPGQVIEQAWFTGVHRDVGGGAGEDTGLSDLAFTWMVEKAQGCELVFNHLSLAHIRPKGNGVLHDSRTGFYKISRPYCRPMGKQGVAEAVHPTAVDRYNNAPSYKPLNLKEYLEDLS